MADVELMHAEASNLTLHPSEGIAYPKIANTGEWEIEDLVFL